MTQLSVADLLERLVAFPSISGSEAGIIEWLALYLKGLGLNPIVDGRNLWLLLDGQDSRRKLLFNTHLDVVPSGDGWDTDPFKPVRKDGLLYGRGANDAKGCAAAMICAIHELSNQPLKGDVLLALTCDEETGGEGLEKLIHKLPEISAAVVGEPTFNKPSLGMRGLMSLRLEAKGCGCHASRPSEGINPIYLLAQDILALESLVPEGKDPVLGAGTLAVTVVEGGSQKARNRVPDIAEAIVDVRTTSVWDNDRAVTQIRDVVKNSEVHIRSSRIKPKATSPDEAIVKAALKATGGEIYAFRGASDFSFVSAPGVILGPGNTSSHQPNEHISLKSLEEAVPVYVNLARGYFDLTG